MPCLELRRRRREPRRGAYLMLSLLLCACGDDSGAAAVTADAALAADAAPDAAVLDPTLHCARAIGGPGEVYVKSLAAAPDGTVFAAGEFDGMAIFGVAGDPAGQVVLTAGDSKDAFVARFDGDCRLLWARSAGGPLLDRAGGTIALAPDDGIYVTGWFTATATFGAGEPGERSLTALGKTDVFVARYRGDGSLAWVIAGGSAGDDVSFGAASTPTALYVAGRIRGNATFGTAQLTAGTARGVAFLIKVDPSGTVSWARQIGDGATNDVDIFGVGAVGDDAAVTGNFLGRTVLGAGEPAETTLVDERVDGFVARYRADGTLAWAKRAGGPAFDQPLAVVADGNGSLLVTGTFGTGAATSTATFGPGEPGEVVLASERTEIFLARYAGGDGTLLDAKRAGGAGDDQVSALHAAGGRFAINGFFGGPPPAQATFGAGEPGETTVTAPDGSAGFVALYAMDGTLTWARTAESERTYLAPFAVTIAGDGAPIVGGAFDGRAIFGSTTLGPPIGGGPDGFLVIYRP